jgi:hypothetical protein
VWSGGRPDTRPFGGILRPNGGRLP